MVFAFFSNSKSSWGTDGGRMKPLYIIVYGVVDCHPRQFIHPCVSPLKQISRPPVREDLNFPFSFSPHRVITYRRLWGIRTVYWWGQSHHSKQLCTVETGFSPALCNIFKHVYLNSVTWSSIEYTHILIEAWYPQETIIPNTSLFHKTLRVRLRERETLRGALTCSHCWTVTCCTFYMERNVVCTIMELSVSLSLAKKLCGLWYREVRHCVRTLTCRKKQ